MADQTDIVTGDEMEQIKILLNTLYLCIGYAIEYISTKDGVESAATFKTAMLESLTNGDIDMALLEEAKTFDLVISKIEALAIPGASSGSDKS